MLGSKHHNGRQQWVVKFSQSIQHSKTVKVRHIEIEQDEIGAPVGIVRQYLARILNQHQIAIALGTEHLVQQLQIRRLIINDENAGPLRIQAPILVHLLTFRAMRLN